MKVIIFGTGVICKTLLQNNSFVNSVEIVAFSDNNGNHWNQHYCDTNISIIPPADICKYEFDYIIVTPNMYYEPIKSQLISLNISPDKIVSTVEFITPTLLEGLRLRYKDSPDLQIQQMLDSFARNGVSMFGDFIRKGEELSEVFWDENNCPYILYYGKKMYFPARYNFHVCDGKKYVRDITMEQRPTSPHLYLQNDDDIKDGAVIVDAGVCEGNFALKYIEKASKVYLIECDPDWMEALKLTFEPWKEKVVFCNKFLDRYDSENTITIDTLVQEKIDFLKMDIEGAEIDALLGGSDRLTQSNALCAICSYHKQNDEKNIRIVLNALGYNTSVSQGYMFFLYDPNIAYSLDFRRGIVYGSKS